MAEIVLDHVSKRYPDGATPVRDLSLTIADGEFLILVGPSGCGKSTTLNMIAGLEDITEGELRIGGQRVNEKAAGAFGGWSDLNLMRNTYTHAEDAQGKVNQAMLRGLHKAETNTGLKLRKEP